MKKLRVFSTLFLTIALLLGNFSNVFAMPPLPLSVSGTVKLDGNNVPEGTIISARINGETYASVEEILWEGDTVYFFDVPGEDPEVPGIQGGVPGDTVVFYIGEYEADQTISWQAGIVVNDFNLTATSNHTVTFNSNGGTGTISPQIANTSTALTLNSFTRTGYSFNGWNTEEDGGGTAYADGETYDFSADLTLYAQWLADTYTVTYNANGATSGTVPADQTKTHDVPLDPGEQHRITGQDWLLFHRLEHR